MTIKTSGIIINAAVFIFLEVASFCMLAAGDSVQNVWIGRGFTNIKAAVWGRIDGIGRYFSLNRENQRLAEENRVLMSALAKGKTCNHSSPAFVSHGNYSFRNADVVTMTTGSQHNYLIMDKGLADGVEVDDGVVTSQGVIGVIAGVSEHFSYAISYANSEMAISAKIGAKESIGSLKWSGYRSDESILSGIPIHTDVEIGDTVWTSGFSSIFPAGIPLGTVKGKTIESGSTAEFTLHLLEDFRNVHHVFIVKNLDRKEIKDLENERQ